MAVLLGKLWDFYNLVFNKFPDPRTKPWFLVAKPYQVGTLLALYLTFVLKWGPEWMKRRPALKLDKILIVYNFLQVLACAYIFVKALEYAWARKYKWFCEPVDWTTDNGLNVAGIVYSYYMMKIVDLLDTVFFVLRKKAKQVSFLHIYHHAGMVLLIWGACTYFPGGHGTLVGVINCVVHVVMYSYYLLTVAVPSVKNSLWWKKYITQLQIVQFFWYVVHMGALIFIRDCEYPRWVAAVFIPQNIFMLVLFIDFYIRAYMNKPKQNQEIKNGYSNENELQNVGHKVQGNGVKNGKVIFQNGYASSSSLERKKE